MKQLFSRTTTLLRTVLLFGVLSFVNTPAKAQTAEQRAAMPDAFETMDPASIIGDGQYYYIQFFDYGGNIYSYLTDGGANKRAWIRDFLPYANNRLWTLVRVSENQFKLRSKDGNYIGYARMSDYGGGDRYGGVANEANAATFTFEERGDGHIILDVQGRVLGRYSNNEWTDLPNMDTRDSNKNYSVMRVAKLKSSAAFLIYYRGEGIDNNDPNASTTYHYMTYSGMDNGTSDVSSRRSIFNSKAAWTLPTAAAYHQDGLWTLESAGDNGEFYIKKYGTEEYLVRNSDNISVLGVKDEVNGVYRVEDFDANRYTPVQTVQYETTTLAANMFYNWNGYGADATQGSEANVAFNIGNNATLGGGATVAGTGEVNYQIYADLSNYTKMIINGTPGMPLRVLMSRQESNSGPLVEKTVTIGAESKAVVDLRNLKLNFANGSATVRMTYVNGSDNAADTSYGEIAAGNAAYCGFNKISTNGVVNLANPDWGVNNLTFLQVDASAISGTIRRVTLKGDFQQIAERPLEYGVGYNYSTWTADMTWNSADRSITTLGGTQTVEKATTDKELSFDITGAFTDTRVRTILVYNLAAGAGYIKNPRVEVEYDPNIPVAYAHLNAIKTGWGGTAGTISSIELVNENNIISTGARYFHHDNGDGKRVPQWTTKYTDLWNAGFRPVEVPVPNKDEFYQVLVKWGENMIDHNGGVSPLPANEADYDLWQLEQIDDYGHFRLKAPDGRYLKPNGAGMTEPNNPEGAEIMDNAKFFLDDDRDFALTWYYVNPTQKEIPVNHYVTHRESYLKQYAQEYASLHLDKQGLATEADSEWKNWNGNLGGFTQKVNHFEITHYIKRNDTKVIDFPTVLNNSNDHVFFQRFYNYDEVDTEMDLENLKAHVSLDDRDDGNVQYFLYRNGMVTGRKLDWTWNDGTDIPDGGYARNEQRRFNFTNSDGKPFTVAVDVSRYDDKTYANPSAHLDGDLEEPSLTMRYIYYMKDAKEMAAQLTACTEGSNKWLETKVFHFPVRQIFYEKQKEVGYRGEFIGLRHVFSDYWVFDDPSVVDTYNAAVAAGQQDLSALNEYLVSAVDNNQGGKIEVVIDDPHGTGIRLGGWNPSLAALHGGTLKFVDDVDTYDADIEADFRGFYFYDKMSGHNPNVGKTQYGDSRFVCFRYPAPDTDGKVRALATGPDHPAYVNVYLNNEGVRYQLAQFTIIFDAGTVTLPYKSINESDYVMKDPDNPDHQFAWRGPKKLIEQAGAPIAKVTFDYPANSQYHFPDKGDSRQGWEPRSGVINGSSPIPLTFDKTNYSFSGFECNWGSYAMVSSMTTNYGNKIPALPANDSDWGYGKLLDDADQQMSAALQADEGLQKGFLYIDASEQPGDICSAPFVGDFCAGDKLMFSGWISGSNKAGGDDHRCPGGITLTVKGEHNMHDADGRIIYDEYGEPKKETVTLYRFCPGQIYELDDGTGPDGSTDASHVVWQQFYFEFVVTDKYDRHWIEVNNNCVSSQGGDFMLDNVAVYAIVPEVKAEVNTPLCVSVDESGNVITDMNLLKLNVNYNKLKSSSGVNDDAVTKPELGFMFLDKQVFLSKFRDGLRDNLTDTDKEYLGLQGFDFATITLDELSDAIEDGEFSEIKEVTTVESGQPGYDEYMAHFKAFEVAYAQAFDAAILGDKKTWHSNTPAVNSDNPSVLYFEWEPIFENLEPYTFAKAVNKTHPVYREVVNGERFLVVNGNYPQLRWKADTDYYLMSSNDLIEHNRPFVLFNLCSECTKANVFRIESPYELIGLEKTENSNDYLVCEGQIPTLVTDLKGYDLNGVEVDMKDLNFDWWLGDKANGVLATLANYHAQQKDGVRLDRALSTLRIYYPEATSLDGITSHVAQGGDPALTPAMVSYLQELVDAGQLVLHQKSISTPATPAAADDPYFYLVACPIHDGYFDDALNPAANEYVAYFCDEPQGVRVKVGEKAPTLKTGFVPGENGFTAYNYPADDPILSIRLAKRAQFETVQHGESTETPVSDPATAATDLHFLWLPVRDAQTQTADGVIRKADDYNIYLASTNDPVWDKNIYAAMNNGALPIVGKIVSLYAKNTYAEDDDVAAQLIAQQNALNRLCIYFTENFEVREGYNYTLSLPFQEEGDVNTCDGTMLINLKIVPDYEVWTGGADNTDWNNDDNWRRADGNLTAPLSESTDESKRNNNELLVSADLPEESGLYQYKTNFWNYRTAKDRLLRKGFAPLYCTHILMKGNEWGDAPVLYDALNGKDDLDAYPFPNLNESYTVNSFEYIGERYESIDALSGKTFAIVNEAEGKVIYGTNVQNLGYGNYPTAMQEGNSGYYYTLESAAGGYLFRLQTPAGNNYEFDAWGRHWDGYLNSQPLTGTVSFVLGLGGWDNVAGQYGMDGQNLGLWTIEENGGKFALKNVGTGKYLKDNSNARYDEPTYFTFCTLEERVVPTMQTRYNILKFDMQARLYDIWSDTYGDNPNKGREGDLIAEMYQINSCDEIAFQPSAELLNAHLLNYNNAWVEYELANERWYVLGSPLQGTISGEWYAPTGTAQQKTTYYENVTFGEGYDRYSPAIYQRSWDKAKAVLYEVGADYSTADNPDDLALDSNGQLPGSAQAGAWSATAWNADGADTYLDRLGYRPLGDKKANVAIKGVWSNTYNDATVDYTKGGFSVMVKNALKNNDQSDGKALIRLPKEDTMYDYYKFEETGANDGGTDTQLGNVQTQLNRALNRGRLKSDLLLPESSTSLPVYQQIQRTETAASRYGDQRTYTRVPTQKGTNGLPLTLQTVQETVSPGISDLGYYMVENPFVTGLDMDKFFEENSQLLKKYWLLTPAGQQLVFQAPDGSWVRQTGEPEAFAPADAKLAPGQGFFVQKDPETAVDLPNTISFTADMQAKTRYGVKTGEDTFTIVVGTKQKMTTKEETITMEDGTTQTVTVEVPEVDNDGNYVIEEITENITISRYVQTTDEDYQFPLKARRTRAAAAAPALFITAQRGSDRSSAMVMKYDEASDDFLPTEDTETFLIGGDLTSPAVPTVYTLCGRLATTVNSIHDFTCLPLGVESNSEAPCTLTFNGVEMLGDSVAFYDAVERKLTPLESGMKFTVSGQTQNRYYIVSSLNEEEVAEETHLQIFTEGRTAKVIASTAEPITDVRCFDTAGRLVHAANPQSMEYSFTVPDDGIYIIEAKTEKDRKTKKVAVK